MPRRRTAGQGKGTKRGRSTSTASESRAQKKRRQDDALADLDLYAAVTVPPADQQADHGELMDEDEEPENESDEDEGSDFDDDETEEVSDTDPILAGRGRSWEELLREWSNDDDGPKGEKTDSDYSRPPSQNEAPEPGRKMEVTLASVNLEKYGDSTLPHTKRLKVEQVVQFLDLCGPDMLVLQEVTDAEAFSKAVLDTKTISRSDGTSETIGSTYSAIVSPLIASEGGSYREQYLIFHVTGRCEPSGEAKWLTPSGDKNWTAWKKQQPAATVGTANDRIEFSSKPEEYTPRPAFMQDFHLCRQDGTRLKTRPMRVVVVHTQPSFAAPQIASINEACKTFVDDFNVFPIGDFYTQNSKNVFRSLQDGTKVRCLFRTPVHEDDRTSRDPTISATNPGKRNKATGKLGRGQAADTIGFSTQTCKPSLQGGGSLVHLPSHNSHSVEELIGEGKKQSSLEKLEGLLRYQIDHIPVLSIFSLDEWEKPLSKRRT